MTDIYLDKQLGERLEEWGGIFNATQIASKDIGKGKPLDLKLARAVVVQLQEHKNDIWDNIKMMRNPEAKRDIRELNRLIEEIENAMVDANARKANNS